MMWTKRRIILLILIGFGLLAVRSGVALAQSPITRLVASSIGLDTPVAEMSWRSVVRNDQETKMWIIPPNAAGWHVNSALPGQGGNIVLSGYNNSRGEVFRDVADLELYDIITLYMGDTAYHYTVVKKLMLKEKGVAPEVRQAHARWIGPIDEERVTLVSAWPYFNSTHKVVVIAQPSDKVAHYEATESLPSLDDNPLPAAINDTNPALAPELPAPMRIIGPAIGLNSDVVAVGWHSILRNGVPANVWQVANYAVGWHVNSALPGQGGNIVLSGHHNIKGKVFRYLADFSPGDLITLNYDGQPYYYRVSGKFIMKEAGEPAAVRRENARWIEPTHDERLTLVSCWPYESNTHRLVVIAKPVAEPPQSAEVDPLVVEKGPPLASNQVLPVALPSALPPAATAPSRFHSEQIGLDAPVISVERTTAQMPDNTVGWVSDAALPGHGGNVLLVGPQHIVNLTEGDTITLHTDHQQYNYVVVGKLILKEHNEPDAVRQANQQWLGPIDEERLTIVTGWPAHSHTHKVIVIARPQGL